MRGNIVNTTQTELANAATFQGNVNEAGRQV